MEEDPEDDVRIRNRDQRAYGVPEAPVGAARHEGETHREEAVPQDGPEEHHAGDQGLEEEVLYGDNEKEANAGAAAAEPDGGGRAAAPSAVRTSTDTD